MANLKFSQFTPVGGSYTPNRATSFFVGYDGIQNVRLTTSEIETGLINWPDYSIKTNYVAVVNNPIVQLDKTTSYGAASSFVQFVGKNGSLVTSDATDRVNIDSGEYSYGVDGTDTLRLTKVGGTAAGPYDVQVVGSGITVSSTGGTNLTLTNAGVTSLAATTPINVSGATGSVTISSNAYTGGTNIGYVPTGGSATTFLRGDGTWVTPTDTDTTYTLTAPNANLIRLVPSSGPSSDVTVSAGTGIALSQAAPNNILITNNAQFTATSATGTIAIGGSPVGPGGTLTLNLPATGVAAGNYTNTDLTVDQYGRITAAANGNIGVTSFTNTNGTFISAATQNAAATGAVTTGIIDLSATGTPSASTFLRGDNTWATPAGGGSSNGAILATNIYHNDSASANLPAAFSFGTATTFNQVQYTTTVGAAVQNVGITVNRPASGFVRIQVQCYILSGDSNNVYLGLHYTPLSGIAGSVMQYGWLNPGHSADFVGQVYELNTYWDIEGVDFVQEGREEEPEQVPIGSPATFYLKGTATDGSTDMLFSNRNTTAVGIGNVQAGWNGGLNLPTNTSDIGGPCIITAYALDSTTRTVNPGLIP